jgi:hypothetical protein
MKIPTNSEAAKKTRTQAQTLRIKNEIKFLYKKKQQLNTQLTTHTYTTQTHGNRHGPTSKNP